MHTLLQLATLQVAPEGATAPLRAGGTAPDLGMLMVVAATLVVLIGGLAFAFKKIVLGQVKARASKRDLAVLDVLPLGSKRQLAVVRCFDRTFALGLGEKDVSLIAELDHEAIQHDRAEAEAEGDGRDPFRARLEAAKAQLLGVRDLLPGGSAPKAPARIETGEVSAPRPGSDREFIA